MHQQIKKVIGNSKDILVIIFAVTLFVVGILTWQNCVARADKVKETKEISKGKVSDWKTYRNKEYGFEIKYPEYLNPEVKTDIAADNIFTLYFGDGKTFSISFFDLGMEGHIRLYTIKDTEKKILIDGIEGLQFKKQSMKDNSPDFLQTIVKKGDKLYVFGGEGKLFNQMLSTFSFLEYSSIDMPNYEVAKNNDGKLLEFYTDLNGDRKEEFIRVYRELTDTGERKLPIMVKIFSGTKDSFKEEFSYTAVKKNEVSLSIVMQNFWGDGRNVVMVTGVSTAYGSGSTQQLHFFAWQNGKYAVVEGPKYSWWQGAASGYMFYGKKAKGTKIILAKSSPVSTKEGKILPHYQFEIYKWDGNQYIKTEGGITKNTYGWQWWEEDAESFIKKIIKAEPKVLETVK